MGNSLNSQPIESNVDAIESLDETFKMSIAYPSAGVQIADIDRLCENATTGISSSKKAMRKNDGDFYQVCSANNLRISLIRYLPIYTVRFT